MCRKRFILPSSLEAGAVLGQGHMHREFTAMSVMERELEISFEWLCDFASFPAGKDPKQTLPSHQQKSTVNFLHGFPALF